MPGALVPQTSGVTAAGPFWWQGKLLFKFAEDSAVSSIENCFDDRRSGQEAVRISEV